MGNGVMRGLLSKVKSQPWRPASVFFLVSVLLADNFGAVADAGRED